MASSSTSKTKRVEPLSEAEISLAPEAHVAETTIVSTDVDTTLVREVPRYRVSLAYLPELFIYLVLLGGLLGSVSGLAAESWRALDNADYNLDTALVVSNLATFLVSLVGATWFGLRTANAEHLQSWRLQQKWRRALYGIFIGLASLALVGSLITAATASLSAGLKIEVPTVSQPSILPFPVPAHAEKWYITVGMALTSALLIGLVLYGVSREYVLSWRRYTKFALAVLGLSGLILGGVLAYKAYDSDKDCTTLPAPYLINNGAESSVAKPACHNTVVPDYSPTMRNY